MSQLFAWGGQSTGVSALESVLPKNTQGWYPSEWTGWISLQSKGLSRVFSNTTVQKHQFFGTQPSSQSNSHIHTWPQEKTKALTRWAFVGKVMSLLLNMLSRLVITFLPMSKCLLISWLQSPSTVILEPPKIKSATVSTVSPSISHEMMGPDAMIFVFWLLSLSNNNNAYNQAETISSQTHLKSSLVTIINSIGVLVKQWRLSPLAFFCHLFHNVFLTHHIVTYLCKEYNTFFAHKKGVCSVPVIGLQVIHNLGSRGWLGKGRCSPYVMRLPLKW